MKSIKLLLLFTFFGLGIMNVSAQRSFAHSAGFGGLIAGDGSNAGTVMYSPRLNFLELGSSTLSFGTHLGLGLSFNSNSVNGSSTTFAYDIPLVLEYNIGGGAGSDNEGGFGFYIGAGYGFSKIASSGFTLTGSNTARGPVANAGFRYTYQGQPVGIRVAMLYDTTDEGSRVLGLGFFYTLPGVDLGGGGGGSSSSRRRR